MPLTNTCQTHECYAIFFLFLFCKLFIVFICFQFSYFLLLIYCIFTIFVIYPFPRCCCWTLRTSFSLTCTLHVSSDVILSFVFIWLVLHWSPVFVVLKDQCRSSKNIFNIFFSIYKPGQAIPGHLHMAAHSDPVQPFLEKQPSDRCARLQIRWRGGEWRDMMGAGGWCGQQVGGVCPPAVNTITPTGPADIMRPDRKGRHCEVLTHAPAGSHYGPIRANGGQIYSQLHS